MNRFQVGPTRLRNGWKARIYALDAGGKYAIHGAYQEEGSDKWTFGEWLIDGKFAEFVDYNSPFDLLPNAVPVITDAALEAFYEARGIGGKVAKPRDKVDEFNAKAIAAAMLVILAETSE